MADKIKPDLADIQDVFADGSEVGDWRDNPAVANEIDPDDEVLRPTPRAVIEELGFDPLEFEEDEGDD